MRNTERKVEGNGAGTARGSALVVAGDVREEAFDDGLAAAQVGEGDALVGQMGLVLRETNLVARHRERDDRGYAPCSVPEEDAARGRRTPSRG